LQVSLPASYDGPAGSVTRHPPLSPIGGHRLSSGGVDPGAPACPGEDIRAGTAVVTSTMRVASPGTPLALGAKRTQVGRLRGRARPSKIRPIQPASRPPSRLSHWHPRGVRYVSASPAPPPLAVGRSRGVRRAVRHRP